MKIEIYKDTKLYVLARAKIASGGPELLHQFVYHLRKDLGINAFIHYIPSNIENPIPEPYKKYKIPFIERIENNKKNILVFPEAYLFVKYSAKYLNIRKIMWWLSIDNFYIRRYEIEKQIMGKLLKKVNRIGYKLLKREFIDIPKYILNKYKNHSLLNDFSIKNINLHLAQSYYALTYLKSQGILNVEYLSDYLNEDFLKTKINLSKKKNIVAYNPKKGYFFTQKLIKYATKIKFIPIENMTREEVIKTLKDVKVYIDFGNHPGKDRLPREAAILGCCVITGKRGSAAFYEDVPIPEEYKFDEKKENIPKIIDKILDCFNNFEERYKDFDLYRKFIKQEPQKFIKDIKKIFLFDSKLNY